MLRDFFEAEGSLYYAEDHYIRGSWFSPDLKNIEFEELTATKIVAKIQSTNANPIIENNLKEGKAVKENSLLLKYNGTPEQTQLSELLTQKKQVLNKKSTA